MRVAYRERLEAGPPSRSATAGALRVRPTRTGLHAIADLEGVEAGAVSRRRGGWGYVAGGVRCGAWAAGGTGGGAVGGGELRRPPAAGRYGSLGHRVLPDGRP